MRLSRYVSWGLRSMFLIVLLGCAPAMHLKAGENSPVAGADIQPRVEIEPGIVVPPSRAMTVYSGASGE